MPIQYDLSTLVPLRHLERHYPMFTRAYTTYLLRHDIHRFADCALKLGNKVFFDLGLVQQWVEKNAVRPRTSAAAHRETVLVGEECLHE